MSTIDNLIDLKDDAVSLAHEVQAALKNVGNDVRFFSLTGDTARALLSHAEMVIDSQATHDEANAQELSEGVMEGIPMGMLPEIPMHGPRALTDFEFDVLMAAHRWMLDHPDREALLAEDLKDTGQFKQAVNVIGSACFRLKEKGYFNRFVSYGEGTYWKPLTKEELHARV